MSTLANAREVLQLIARLQQDLTVSVAAEELGAPKSSVSRTLAMMAEYGFLERDLRTRAYRPGPLVMEASYHFRRSRNAVSLLEDEVRGLVEATGFTGYLTMLDQAESLVVSMRTGTAGTLQAYTPVGTRAPAYASSMGRAILARLDDDEVTARVGAKFERFGSAPHDTSALLEELAQIRTEGWSLSRGEFVSNVAGIAAATIEPDTDRGVAIGIALPAHDVDDALRAGHAQAVRDAAMRVGKNVGDPYWLDFHAS